MQKLSRTCNTLEKKIILNSQLIIRKAMQTAISI